MSRSARQHEKPASASPRANLFGDVVRVDCIASAVEKLEAQINGFLNDKT
jgi:hypothetical protein